MAAAPGGRRSPFFGQKILTAGCDNRKKTVQASFDQCIDCPDRMFPISLNCRMIATRFGTNDFSITPNVRDFLEVL